VNTRMQIPAKPMTASHLASEPFGILRRKCACGGSTGECAECPKKKLQQARTVLVAAGQVRGGCMGRALSALLKVWCA
jgi:hypothetical protein